MTITQIDPPILLDTKNGPGIAHFLIMGSIEDSLRWVIFLESGQIWCIPNEEVRAVQNFSAFRPNPEKP